MQASCRCDDACQRVGPARFDRTGSWRSWSLRHDRIVAVGTEHVYHSVACRAAACGLRKVGPNGPGPHGDQRRGGGRPALDDDLEPGEAGNAGRSFMGVGDVLGRSDPALAPRNQAEQSAASPRCRWSRSRVTGTAAGTPVATAARGPGDPRVGAVAVVEVRHGRRSDQHRGAHPTGERSPHRVTRHCSGRSTAVVIGSSSGGPTIGRCHSIVSGSGGSG